MKKINLNKTVRFVALLFALYCLSGIVVPQEKPPSANEKREAEKAWEALVKTKGGREKLHSITNMLTETETLTGLDILPNLYWQFHYRVDGKPFVSILDIKNDEYDSYYAGENGVLDIKHLPFSSARLFYRVAYLLETKYDKPEPLRINLIKKGRKTFDVIETIVYGKRLDFIYDPEELLVSQINFYDEKGANSEAFLLSDYTQINGIQMPRTWGYLSNYKQSTWKTSKSERIRFSFNVDYNPKLFKRPLRAGSKDDWKPKKNN